MKKSIISFMALALLCSCVPDHRDFNMPEVSVYFTDNSANKGVQEVVMYDVQSDVETPVYVHCAGLKAGSAKVSAKVSEDYIEYYNKINYTDYKALPENCYTIVKSSDALQDRTAAFSVSFDVPSIMAFSKEPGVNISDYVLALELGSEKLPIATVKDTTSLGYYMVKPVLKTATLQIKSTGLSPDGTMTVTAELPFDNAWDLTYDVEFAASDVDVLFTDKGNSKPAKYVFASKFPDGTVIGNEDVKSMAPGTNKVEYAITIPAEGMAWAPGKASNYAVRFSNAFLNGKQIPIENPLATGFSSVGVEVKAGGRESQLGVNLAQYGLTPLDDKQGGGRSGNNLENIVPGGGFIFHAQTAQDTRPNGDYSIAGAFDDNVTNTARSWMQNWGGGAGYGSTGFGLPYWLLVDMQEEFKMGGIEFWTRADGRYNMKVVEVYALDECSYELNKSVLNYDAGDVTYLGTLKFSAGGQCLSISLAPVTTRYIMMLVTQSGNGLDCQELVLWGC